MCRYTGVDRVLQAYATVGSCRFTKLETGSNPS